MTTDLNTFLSAIRDQLPELPDPRLEADLVSRSAAVARAELVTAPMPRARRPAPWAAGGLRRLALPARIALASFGLVLSTAGLAIAGVGLPGPVDSAFEKVGVSLPNQSSATDEESATVPGEADPASQRGRSAAAKRRHSEQGEANANHNGSHARGNGRRSGTPGNSATAPGQNGSAGPGGTPPIKSKRLGKGLPYRPAPPVTSHRGSGEKKR